MTPDEFAKTANALLAEGIELLRAHAGEGDVINRYVATVEKVQAQYRAAKEAPATASDVYTGPVTAGMRFGHKDSVFVPDGRRGSMGEFLNARGDGLSEPNLRGMYRPIPPPAPEPSAPPAVVPMCKAWCGKPSGTCFNYERPSTCVGGAANLPCWCSHACMASKRPLNPPPSAPVTVATGGDECPGCDDHCEDEKCPAAHGPCVDEPVATGGVPAGYRLGDGWSIGVNDWDCTNDDCSESAVYEINCGDDERDGVAACAAHAVEMGAIVPIDTARSAPPGPLICDRCKVSAIPGDTKCWRCNWGKLIQEPVSPPVPPGPVHPATGTTCTRCGQVIQSVLPAFPPVATVDGWRHERCPEVPPEPVRDSIDALRYAVQGVPPGPVPVDAPVGIAPRSCFWHMKPCDCPPAAPASEPAVRPLLSDVLHEACAVPTEWAERAAALEAELAATARDYQVARDAHDRRHDDYNAARAEVEQLRKALDLTTELRNACEREAKAHRKALQDIATTVDPAGGDETNSTSVMAAIRAGAAAMEEVEQLQVKLAEASRATSEEIAEAYEAAANVARGWKCFSRDAENLTAHIALAIRALPLDTGTATAPGGEVTTLCEHGSDGNCRRCYMAEKSAQADAIKAAPHVCKCSNGPCPKCGGTGPEGEWFEGSEVECADCGAPLIVATAEPCHGSSTFEAIDEEPDEEDDESGEDAPGAVGK